MLDRKNTKDEKLDYRWIIDQLFSLMHKSKSFSMVISKTTFFCIFHYVLHLFEEGMWRSVALELNQDYLSRRIMEASCAVFLL